MNGPCAKRVVTCRLENQHPSGEIEIVETTNWCANPQVTCPRLDGEGYEKCATICQSKHAEIRAIELAEKGHIYLVGGRAIVSGHYHCCDHCTAELKRSGITDIVIAARAAVGEV